MHPLWSTQGNDEMGAPVCQPCYDGLEATQSDLEAMEADDPTLKAAGERVEQAVRKYLGGT